MTFKITEFSSVVSSQVVDVRTPGARYNRSRVEGNKKPYWMFELTSTPLPYEEAMGVSAHLDSLNGSLEIFTMPPPLPALAVRTGLTIHTASVKGSNILYVGGFTANQLSSAKAGDYMQLAGHQKAYRIVENANADATGEASITVTPRLFEASVLNEVVKYGDAVQIQCCLEDVVEMPVKANSGKYVAFDLTVMEQG
jgi:hypothetical protein